jgi:hypothetical protein
MAIQHPIFLDLCSFDTGDRNICTAIRRTGFSCDETLYFASLRPIDDMVLGLEEFVIVCTSKRPYATLLEESGIGCVFVRFFHVAHVGQWLPGTGQVTHVREIDVSHMLTIPDVLSTADKALVDRKLEPCDMKNWFPRYQASLNEERIKKARQDSLERACRKRVLNCGPHGPYWP